MSTGNPMLDSFMEVFDGRGGDYEFTMSHVAISGHGIEVEFDAGEYVLTQREDGHVWTARSEYKTAAVLLLIAARVGFVGELRYAADTDEVAA